MDRKTAAIDRADRRTDRLTPDRYMDPAALLVGSVNSRTVSVSVESRVGAELAVQSQQRRTTAHDTHSCSQHCRLTNYELLR